LLSLLCDGYEKLAELTADRSDEEAEGCYAAALALRQQLIDLAPERADWKQLVALALGRRAARLASKGDYEQAAACYDQARTTLEAVLVLTSDPIALQAQIKLFAARAADCRDSIRTKPRWRWW
jgi:tetratricopeptide (TPR) repeat protein